MHSARITIREEQSDDVAAIRRVVQEAFGRSDEADLIDKLRANGKFRLSLVADLDGHVVGQFTEVAIEDADLRSRVSGGIRRDVIEGSAVLARGWVWTATTA